MKRPPYADFAHEAELTPTFGRLALQGPLKQVLGNWEKAGGRRKGFVLTGVPSSYALGHPSDWPAIGSR